jgi:isoquinoline 1-oxidoreductase alpha subunit
MRVQRTSAQPLTMLNFLFIVHETHIHTDVYVSIFFTITNLRLVLPAGINRFSKGTTPMKLTINGKETELNVSDDMPILWAIRDVAGMTGTKFGCGMAQCGACTVHLDGQAIRSCVTPVSAAVGKQITTIEAMQDDKVGQAVQAAWQQIDVVQCGYCQSGQIMSATSLLKQNPKPSDADIDAAMSGNICRCGTYQRIRTAIHEAAAKLA